MPASLQEVKRRIVSTKKTGQITSAMQMVSTAKLSQIQKHSVSYQVYASKIRSVITHLAQSHLLDSASVSETGKDQAGKLNTLGMLKQRPVKKTGIVVVTSDRGLVGSHTKDDVVIIAVGGTGAEFFSKRGYNVAYEFRGVKDVPTFREVRPIVEAVVTMYSNGLYDQLFVCYNHFVNTLTSIFRAEKMLPITAENMGDDDLTALGEDQKYHIEYETEPSRDAILEVILPQYAESLVYGAILDAKTSEHASSSTAMKSASDNAKDIISALELQYNRARQSAITTEITEITGAQAALD